MAKGRTVPEPPTPKPPSDIDPEADRLISALTMRFAVILDRRERRLWDRTWASRRAGHELPPEFLRLCDKVSQDPIAGPLIEGLNKRVAELRKET